MIGKLFCTKGNLVFSDSLLMPVSGLLEMATLSEHTLHLSTIHIILSRKFGVNINKYHFVCPHFIAIMNTPPLLSKV